MRKPRELTALNFFRHPIQFFKQALTHHASPSGLAASAAVGIVLATLPLFFIHTITIIYVTSRLHLNKVMAVSIQNLCMPPFVPLLCIEIGHWMLHGAWLTHVSKEAFLGKVPGLMLDWLVGSLVVAPLLAILVAIAVYFIAKQIRLSKKISAPG